MVNASEMPSTVTRVEGGRNNEALIPLIVRSKPLECEVGRSWKRPHCNESLPPYVPLASKATLSLCIDEEITSGKADKSWTIVDALIESANGQILGTAGDSVLAEFPSVVQTFNCTIAIQLAIARVNADIPVESR
jgi:hypothetical protein